MVLFPFDKANGDMQRQWFEYLNSSHVRTSSSYHAPLAHSSERGRPKFEISMEQLLYLRSMCFTWTQIAKILGVSLMTIYRRRQALGLIEEPSNSHSNRELHTILLQLQWYSSKE